jgi:hypothetical protein
MARTTLQLEDDALKAAKAHAARHQISLGQAVSALVRRGLERPFQTTERNGIHVFQAIGMAPKITDEQVAELLDESA